MWMSFFAWKWEARCGKMRERIYGKEVFAVANDTMRAWAEIRRDAFVHNLAVAKKLTGKPVSFSLI